MTTWISDLFRTLMSALDRMVYWAIELLSYLFNAIANFNLFASSSTDETVTLNETMLENISERIYILIAIVMIFKVSFSIIQYIINPDTFTDNERGMGKIIQNVVITLVCLVGVRFVFNIAYDLQYKIIKNHVIETLILGIDTDLTKENQENISNQLSFTILSSFITPNTTDGIFEEKDGKYLCGGDSNNSSSLMNQSSAFIGCVNGITKEGKYPSISVRDSNGELKKFTDVQTGDMYAKAYEYYNYNLLLDIINHKWIGNPDKYLFEYKYIISTVAGVFVAIMYLNFCIDLAVRTVKFAFLQLIAPIPIISMIDPKSSKNGMMSKWVKSCISTYLGLFVRIAAVSFVILIISLISKNEAATSNGFVKLFIIFGALQFAKELPKLISELTGINLDGNFKMNPLKRMPGVEKIGGAALTGAAGAIGGGIAAGRAAHLNGRNAGSIIGSSLTGTFRGAAQGMKAGFGSGLKGVIGKAQETTKGIGAKYSNYGDSTMGDRFKANLQSKLGLSTAADIEDKTINMMKQSTEAANNLDSYMEKEVLKNKGGVYQDLADAKNALDMIGAVDRNHYYSETTDSQGNVISRNFNQAAYEQAVQEQAKQKSKAETRYYAELKKAKQSFFNSNRSNDNNIIANMNIINENQQKLSNDQRLSSESAMANFDANDYNSVDDYNKLLKGYSSRVQTETDYKKHHDAKNSIGK